MGEGEALPESCCFCDEFFDSDEAIIFNPGNLGNFFYMISLNGHYPRTRIFPSAVL